MKTRIALLGQPNSGKSTVYNALTGSRQHVGNWPGKTASWKKAVVKLSADSKNIELFEGMV